MKKCKNCNLDFTSNKIAQRYCGNICAAKANRVKWLTARNKRGRKRKEKLIELSGGCCSSCGYKKCYRALCFHHRDENTKTFTLDQSNLYKYTYNKIIDEYNKCDLLCQNCHQELHEIIDSKSIKSSANLSRTKLSHNRKLELIKLLGNKCSKCGYRHEYCISSLTFHHINKDDKNIEINSLTIRDKYNLVLSEVPKVILLCFNCHMEEEAS